jgi:hypothetical protein
MNNKDFAVFILTHGRPDNVITYSTIKQEGYTGKVYIIIDTEDETANKYYENYKDKVIMFDKEKISKKFDEADNFKDRRSIVYARNACFEIAKDLGITYFMQLDDDYTSFQYKLIIKNKTIHSEVKNLDRIFTLMLDYYKSIKAKSIAFAQGGDFIGGIDNGKSTYRFNKRKCMNSFICSTDRPFQFKGRINEDVNVYTNSASKGFLFLTIPYVSLVQKQTQSNSGGMTDIYQLSGTYIKSFYTVLFQPSSVVVGIMQSTNKRLHHKIKWDKTTPMILNEKHKK